MKKNLYDNYSDDYEEYGNESKNYENGDQKFNEKNFRNKEKFGNKNNKNYENYENFDRSQDKFGKSVNNRGMALKKIGPYVYIHTHEFK